MERRLNSSGCIDFVTFALRPNSSGLKRETDGVVPLHRDGQDGQHAGVGDGQLHEGDKVAHRLKSASHGGKKFKNSNALNDLLSIRVRSHCLMCSININ